MDFRKIVIMGLALFILTINKASSHIQVKNVLGLTVLEGEVIDLSTLPCGIYFRLENDSIERIIIK